jgi:hypothetical protein
VNWRGEFTTITSNRVAHCAAVPAGRRERFPGARSLRQFHPIRTDAQQTRANSAENALFGARRRWQIGHEIRRGRVDRRWCLTHLQLTGIPTRGPILPRSGLRLQSSSLENPSVKVE